MSVGRIALVAVRYVVAAAALVVFLFPLYWLAATALKTPEEILTYPPVWWPAAPQWERAREVISEPEAVKAILDSLTVAVLSTVLAVALGTAGALAIARRGLGGRLFAGWALASCLAPPVLIVVPALFGLSLMGEMNRLGSLAGLVAVLTVFNLPYVLWMMRGYLRDVPQALEDTALVAGYGRDEIPRRVYWPMVRGGLVATSAFTFVLAWNELVFALVLAGDSVVTLPLRIARAGDAPEGWATLAALCVVATLPVLVAVMLMGRRLARSLSFGIVRGGS